MRRAVLKGAGSVAIEQAPEPSIESPTDAVVRVTLSAVSGTDLSSYRNDAGASTGLGHEFVGVVSAIGDAVTRLAVGQRIVAPPAVFCNGCFYCKLGLLGDCEKLQRFGGELGGANAEYVRVPNADAVLDALPDAVSDENAVLLAELLTGVYAGLELVGVHAGDSVAVVGCGPTGLAAVLLAKTMGAGRLFAIDHHDYRLAAAEALGATPVRPGAIETATGGRGVDVAVEAAGTAEALSTAGTLVRRWGTLLSLGRGVEEASSFPVGRLTAENVRLVAAATPAVKNYLAPVLKMVARNVFDPSPLISHTLPLDEAPRAYEIAASRSDGALKVLLHP